MKKIVSILAMAIAMIAMTSCWNSPKQVEAVDAETEVVDSVAVADSVVTDVVVAEEVVAE